MARRPHRPSSRKPAPTIWPLYIDQESKALAAVNALGLPATLIVNKDGKEAARLLGPADWASDEAKAIIRELMK